MTRDSESIGRGEETEEDQPDRHQPAGQGGHQPRDEGACQPGDEGAMSAEYAVATVAAVAFAGLLIAVIRSPEIQEALLTIIRGALTV